jgi:transposase
MARERIKMKKIREIIRLKAMGITSEREIARALKIGRPAVAKYWAAFENCGISLEQVKAMSDTQLLAIMGKTEKAMPGRLQVLSGNFPQYVIELKKTGVTLDLLWEEYKREHPDGYQYSQFCYHYELFRKSCDVVMHIEHKPGDKMFVDYAGDKLILTDPIKHIQTSVEVFVAVLGASGLAYVEASMSQKQDDWIRSNERAMRYFTGVPKAIVPDNLKAAVVKCDPYEPGINPQFDAFAEYYGTVILPARARKPRYKALVENAVRLVYQRIYARLRNRVFHTLDELNAAIQELLEAHNNKKFKLLPYSRRELFEQTDQAALNPLPTEAFPIKTPQYARVQFNYHVWLKEDMNYYSVPWILKQENKDCEVLILYDDRIVTIIYDNVRVAQHFRDRTPNKYTTDPSHMPPHHRFVSGWNPERFRSWAEGIGPDVVQTVNRVLNSVSHPEQGYKRCLGILNAGKKFGNDILQRACKKANGLGVTSCNSILGMAAQIKEADGQPELEWEVRVPDHDNIRGSEYYN